MSGPSPGYNTAYIRRCYHRRFRVVAILEGRAARDVTTTYAYQHKY